MINYLFEVSQTLVHCDLLRRETEQNVILKTAHVIKLIILNIFLKKDAYKFMLTKTAIAIQVSLSNQLIDLLCR